MLRTANNYKSVFKRRANAVSESKYGESKSKNGRPCEYDSENADVCLTCDKERCTGSAACMAKRRREMAK
ncbi:MAG: hypothetical protein ACI4QZ_07265 [Eubacteriales bacterium]